jgi:thiopurine S-methyltransferase
MHEDFWRARWNRNEIGFHLPEVNPWLLRHWAGEPGTRVLVPLCGKSLDMAWLAGQGHRVLGVELMETAVQAFFAEQGLTPEISDNGRFRCYRHGELELWCGDFFALRAEDVADCARFYDRAALIALPPALRERYVAHLAAILPTHCEGLLVTVEYDQALRDGPPFAVDEAEVQALWGAAGWSVALLERRDVLAENWKFMKLGATRLDETAYRLAR